VHARLPQLVSLGCPTAVRDFAASCGPLERELVAPEHQGRSSKVELPRMGQLGLVRALALLRTVRSLAAPLAPPPSRAPEMKGPPTHACRHQ